jgi:hypothetical protein
MSNYGAKRLMAENNSTVEISNDTMRNAYVIRVWKSGMKVGSDGNMKPAPMSCTGIHTRCLHLALEPCRDEAIVPPDRVFNRALIWAVK